MEEQLLTLLRANARAPIEDLAKELDTTESAVRKKITELESEGVILGYQAIIDSRKQPHEPVTAVIEVRITPERGGGFDRIASRISKFTEVQGCYLMSGGYDLLVVAQGETLQEIATFISQKLSTIQGVLGTATHFRMKAYKENGVALQREKRAARLPVAP